jgi:hypothetical protein
MSKKSTPTDLSSSELNDGTSSSEGRKRKSSKRRAKKDSIKNYVNDILTKHEKDREQNIELSQTQIKIGTTSNTFPQYENVSAFRTYQSRTNRNNLQQQNSSSDEELENHTTTQRVTSKFKFNLSFSLFSFLSQMN